MLTNKFDSAIAYILALSIFLTNNKVARLKLIVVSMYVILIEHVIFVVSIL